MHAAFDESQLSPAQISVMRHKVTEPPYYGKYWDHFEPGTYLCAACHATLFSSLNKFDSRTGWPSFKKPISEQDLQFRSESGPEDKIEVRCKKCKSHLGYVITGDEPYYRINSVCLSFVPATMPKSDSAVADEKPHRREPTAAVSAARDSSPRESSWHTPSLVVGALTGIVLGTAGTLSYFSASDAPISTLDATSSSDMFSRATSTPDGLEAPGAQASETLPSDSFEPVVEPPIEALTPENTLPLESASGTN